MIRNFTGRETEKVFQRRRARRRPDIQRTALSKLLMIHAAERLDDLRVPPGNRLRRLAGNRAGQYAVRVNNRWRICFVWRGGGAHDVEITGDR